jgi:hypothetical protein
MKQAGLTAPFAPAAQAEFNPRINLPSFLGPLGSPNPISQFVGSSFIRNTTLEGHVFYNGSVDFQFTATSATTSNIDITGTGTNSSLVNALADDVFGYLFFSMSAGSVADLCAAADAGMGYPGT